jgi:hypothetical protein
MENNAGWHTWVAEPVVSAGGGFELMQDGEASCRPLNSEAIDEIVEAVDRLYDVFFAKATRETPARNRNTSSATYYAGKEVGQAFQPDTAGESGWKA